MQGDPTITTRRGLMLVLSAPSGAGKSTISRALLEREKDLSLSISATTRAPRPGEVHGKHYFFVDHSEFSRMVSAGKLLEHAKVFENCYGTPRDPVELALREGHDVMFDIDWQGAQQLRDNARGDVVGVFILPPSHAELERRLRDRGQDSDEVIQGRMKKAADEMSHWGEYDYVVINDDLEESITAVRSILIAERLKRDRRVGLPAFVRNLCEGD